MWPIEKRIREEIRRTEELLSVPGLSGEKRRWAEGRMTVLRVMLDRLERSKADWHGHGWYDEESDFDACYENTVEELIEAGALEPEFKEVDKRERRS